MKNFLFPEDDMAYFSEEVYNSLVNSFYETMKGSGTPITTTSPITTTCIKPSYFSDGVIRETSPGIYPQQQKEYIKINNISNDKE